MSTVHVYWEDDVLTVPVTPEAPAPAPAAVVAAPVVAAPAPVAPVATHPTVVAAPAPLDVIPEPVVVEHLDEPEPDQDDAHDDEVEAAEPEPTPELAIVGPLPQKSPRSLRAPLRRLGGAALVVAIGAAGWFVGRPALGTFLDQRTINAYAAGDAGGQIGEAGFAADFPRTPTRTTMTTLGDVQVPFTYLESRVGAASFSVGYFDVARDVDEDRTILDQMARTAASSIDGKLTGTDDAQVNGDPAIDYTATTAGGQYVKARAILHAQTAYVIQSISTSPDVPGHDRFVQSFRIV